MKYSLPVFFILLLLISSCSVREEYGAAKEGYLDLSQVDWENTDIVLGGTWLYYPSEFFTVDPPEKEPSLLYQTSEGRRKNGLSAQGWGSYILHLRLPEHNPELQFFIRETQAAYRIIINGSILGGSGQLGRDSLEGRPGKKILPNPFKTQTQEITLIILYSNFDHREGAFPLLTLGSSKNITRKEQWKLYRDIFFTGTFLAVAFLYLILYFRRKKESYSLWFGLICLLMALRVLLTDSALIDRFTPEEWIPLLMKVEYAGLILLVSCFFMFTLQMFPEKRGKILIVVTLFPSLIYLGIVLISPMRFYTSLLHFYQGVILFTGGISFYRVFAAWLHKRQWAGSLLALIVAMMIASVIDILYYDHRITFGPITGYMTYLAILSQGYILINRFARNQDRLEDLSSDYRKANVALYSNQKKIEEQNKRLNQLAFVDQLTQLPNRISMQEILGNKLELARREGNLLGVFYIDIDNFKRLNDTLGQGMGDTILYHIAQRLKQSLRKSDNLFRISGDEFLILAEDLKQEDQVSIVAEKIQNIFKLPLKVEGNDYFITASTGVAHWSQDHKTDSITALVRKADVAVTKAKEQGKNCYVFYTREMDQELSYRVRIEEKMRQALLEDHFVLFYQAQIDMDTGRLHGFEALIRWMDPEEGMIPPDQFIPFAETSGMIVEIGKWVLNESCRQIREWLDSGFRDFSLSVNLSARQFEREDLIPFISEVISRWLIPPEYLVLELTESSLMMDVEKITDKMIHLKELGLRIAIDDFGTGYSNLSYLSSFPLDILKIDKMFISNIQKNDKDRKLVFAIINIAHSLGLDIVAEGVESEDDKELLCSKGCRYIQGYLYSRPNPKDDALEFFDFTLKEEMV